MKIEVDENSSVTFKGIYKSIRYQVTAHNFKDERKSQFDFEAMWATYLMLSEEQYAELKDRLDHAPWNGGITFNQRHTHEHLDCPAELKAKWDKPFYKIGDDFSHLWDSERGGWGIDARYSMECHIKRVIDFLVGDSQ